MTSLRIHIFDQHYQRPKTLPTKTVLIEFSPGDRVRPWLFNNDGVEPVYGDSFIIQNIIVTEGVAKIIDKRGREFNGCAIQFGLTEATKKLALSLCSSTEKPFDVIPFRLLCEIEAEQQLSEFLEIEENSELAVL